MPGIFSRTAGPAVVAGLALVVACHHAPPPAAPTPVAAAPAPPPPAPAPQPTVTPVSDNSANLARLRETLGQMIFFDFDRSELSSEARAILDAKLPILNANPQIRIQISGNCDDRGSDEYNLALGQRRAAIAKRYLTDHGIDASRIEIISYGKERPVAQGNDESSWARNRNDQTVVVAGGDQMRAGG